MRITNKYIFRLLSGIIAQELSIDNKTVSKEQRYSVHSCIVVIDNIVSESDISCWICVMSQHHWRIVGLVVLHGCPFHIQNGLGRHVKHSSTLISSILSDLTILDIQVSTVFQMEDSSVASIVALKFTSCDLDSSVRHTDASPISSQVCIVDRLLVSYFYCVFKSPHTSVVTDVALFVSIFLKYHFFRTN